MNPDDIDNLEAGQDLDMLVAENIMWAAAPQPSHTHWPDPYSTDISAAWLVVEKLRDTRLTEPFSQAFDAPWPWFTMSAPEMAVRICIAALKATLCQQEHI